MYNKIKRELYATDCECFEIKFYTADRLPCLAVKCSKNDHLNLEECTRQLTRMMDFNALRLCCSKLNPACLCYDSKPAKLHKAR